MNDIVETFEPIGDVTPAPGWHAVWNDKDTLVDEPIVGWVRMRVTEKTLDSTGRVIRQRRRPNEIHGMVASELGVRSAQEDRNFFGYRGQHQSMLVYAQMHGMVKT